MIKTLYDRKKLFSTPELKARGWTSAARARFLRYHDDTRANPHGGVMKFYLTARVKRKERSKAWQSSLEQSITRKAASQRAVETKTDRLDEYVKSIKVEVPLMTRTELVSRAIEHYNEFWFGTGKRAVEGDDDTFLERISVNYLRHELTLYERHLDEIAGKTGARGARSLLRSTIYDKIGETYPDLWDECMRQELDRWERDALT